jgi:predicted RNase H-like HicB family nuclease
MLPICRSFSARCRMPDRVPLEISLLLGHNKPSVGGIAMPTVCATTMKGAMTSRYIVVLHPSEEGFAVSCPGLPGCWSQGSTEEESLDNIQDAIREYLAATRESMSQGLLREVEVTV